MDPPLPKERDEIGSMLTPNELMNEVEKRLKAIEIGHEKGKKKLADAALAQLVKGLEKPNNNAPRVLCECRKGQTNWDSVLKRVKFFLWPPHEEKALKKLDADRLRVLVGLAASAGSGALSAKVSTLVFVTVLGELQHKRTPARIDKTSPHVELIGALLLLTSQGAWVERLPAPELSRLFDAVLDWVSDDGSGQQAGPHASIAGQPVVLQYAQILHHLVSHWRRDMLVVEDDEDG